MTLSATTSIITHSLAWALLYSLWQGLLVYGSLFVLLRAMPDINSRVKYYLSVGAFAGLFIWFADTWILQYEKLKGAVVYITSPGTEHGATVTHAVKTFGAQTQNPMLRLLPGLERYFPFIMVMYTIGLSFMLFRFLVSVLQLRALRNQGITTPEQQWNDFIRNWQKQFEITRPVKLFLSTHITVPMMLGSIKPIILLPVATINNLSTEQVEAILLHELAHIKRHDYLLNMLQTIGEIILFFNPFVWLISSVIRKERELCCDDLVVENAANPLPYASALALLEGNRQTANLALAASGNKNQLFHRIKRIMEMKKNNLNYSQLTIIIVAIIAISFTLAMFTFTPSFAQKAKKEYPADTTKKNVYRYKKVTIDDKGNRTEEIRESDKPFKDNTADEENDAVVSSKDNSGQKTKKEIIIAHKDRDNIVIDLDADEITKDAYEKVVEAMKKGKAEIEKMNNPEMQKEILAEIDAAMKEAKEGLEDGKKEMEQLEKEMKKTHRIIITNGSSMPDLPDMPDMPEAPAIAPMPPIPPVAPMPPMPGHKLNSYEAMLNEMERDGLIDRSGTYAIKKANSELYINGELQPDNVYNKYSRYLNGKTMTIKGRKGNLKINIIE